MKTFMSCVYCLLFIMLLTICAFAQDGSNKLVIEKNGSRYLANTVIVKLKKNNLQLKGQSVQLSSGIMKKAEPLAVKNIAKVYKAESSELSKIVEIKYSAKKDPAEAAAELMESGEVEWAEPRYLYLPNSSVNDPEFAKQWNLQNIMAEKAWELCKGDTNIVIGIVDSGVDWDHPDLAANIKTNWKEIPGNGIDDDNNGYVDDVRGWDFGGLNNSPDNDPVEDKADHGTHVAGIASAVTNNSTGIASIGYNCRLLPVKVSSDNMRSPTGGPYIIYGFEGIVYAADNGARIINCSWGGADYSKAGQDAINYALSKGALVVVSAGNANSSTAEYPACYDGVMSVAATDVNDARCSFSSYGKRVSVSAPGGAIYSTWFNDVYATMSGTSMAAPLVSGLAALVATKFPGYTSAQIKEQIRVNTDNIIAPGFEYMLGSGRINAYKALANTKAVSVRATDCSFNDDVPGGDGNGSFEPNEEITLKVNFINMLNPISSVNITLECTSPYVNITTGSFNSGAVQTLKTFSNSTSGFKFVVRPDAPANTYVSFILKYSGDGYSDFQWIDSVLINPAFQTISSGVTKLTLTSDGNLGFCDWWTNSFGQGFKYNNSSNLLYEGALMFGNSSSHISNSARGITEKDSSFNVIKPVKLSVPGLLADEQSYGVFNDDGALDNKLGVEVHASAFAWNKSPYNKFVILNYAMINKSNAAIENLYTGLYLDWNLTMAGEQADNAAYDENNKFGYAFRAGNQDSPYVGCALLGSDKINFYAIENGGRDGGIGVYSGSGGFTKNEKWIALTNGLKKTRADNGDVSFVISQGPNSIKANDTINVAFAIAAGDNFEDLSSSVAAARKKFNYLNISVTGVANTAEIPYEFNMEQNYPNPFNPSTIISFSVPKEEYINLSVYNVLGQKIKTLVSEIKKTGTYKIAFNANNAGRLSSGVYFYSLEGGGKRITRKMIIMK